MLYSENLIVFFCEIHTKHINTMRAECMIIYHENRGTYINL